MRAAQVIMSVAVALLAGCSHHDSDPGISAASTMTSAAPLVPPPNPNDMVAWRAFLGKAILAETHDSKLHPYAFVVPAGDAAVAAQQRRGEAIAVHGLLGRTAVPGNMLALTGPDSIQVTEVINEAFKDVPAQGARGLTILYIGAPTSAVKAQAIVQAAGAELRMRPMRSP